MKWFRSPGSRRLPIEVAQWQALVERLPFLRGYDEAAALRFRETIALFLTRKAINGAAGLEVDDAMRLSIAAQACLPVLELDLRLYDDFSEVIVYPAAFRVRRTVHDDSGVVHESHDVLSGEAMHGGPVVLSWEDVERSDGESVNVVVHEFAHKLDMAGGEADGVPPMPAALRARWHRALEEALDDFGERLDRAEAMIPRHLDPESEEADVYYASLPLDPYAATDPSEFFAVAAESFFVDPWAIADAWPRLYACLVEYFRTDPRKRLESARD